MVAAFADLPFSEFLHHPSAVAERLADVRVLRLRRRGFADLALMRADQAERDGIVVDFTAGLLAGLVRHGSPETLRTVLPEALPWVTFLPEADVVPFIRELVTVAQGAASIEDLTPLSVLLTQWRHTAEVYADPALLDILTREPEGDLGPVPAPPAQLR
jgi:hypothetical protein